MFIFVAVALFAISKVCAIAQQSERAAGGYLGLAVGDVVTNVGIGGKFQYFATDRIRMEGSFNYFVPRTYTYTTRHLNIFTGWYTQTREASLSMWDLSVNGHYLFPISDEYSVYGLFGLSVLGATSTIADIKTTDTGVGINLGSGADFIINEQVTLNGELMYRIGEWSRLMVGVVVVFKF